MKSCPKCKAEYADDVEFCPNDGMKLRRHRDANADPLLHRALDGRWIIEEKIGEGGMGAVYRGHQKSVNRRVAIKTLRSALVDSDEFVERFFREAEIATKIAHPHCVTILDFGQAEDDTLYLAMEYLDGTDLTTRANDGDLSLNEIVTVGIQVSSALSSAHTLNIVHRDLKPDNIFMLAIPGGGTFAKVLDFGIAKALDAEKQVTRTGMIFGTPEYMSPEQCRGGDIDGRSDLYSLGCILYELLGGRTPFAATTPMAVLMAHVNEDVPSFQTKGVTHVPPGLDAIVMKLLEKEPENRFASAQEARLALEGELGKLENPSLTGQQAAAGIAAPNPTPAPAASVGNGTAQIGFDNTVGFDTSDHENPFQTDFTGGAETMGTEAPSSSSKLPLIAGLLVLGVIGAVVAIAVVMMNNDGPADEPDPTVEASIIATANAAETEPAEVAAQAEKDEEPAADPEIAEVVEEPADKVELVEAAPAKKKRKAKKSKSSKKKAAPEPKPEPEVAAVKETPAKAVDPPPKKVEKKEPAKSESKVTRESKRIGNALKGIGKGADKAADDLMDNF